MKLRKMCIEVLLALLASVLMLASISGQDPSKEKAAAKMAAGKADPTAIAKLIQQLGSDDFRAREKASQQLAQLDEVPDALRQAAKNSDTEIARRAQAAIDIITERVEERVFREMVGKLHQIELDRFVRRMVMEPKFADDKQWKVIQTVAKAVIDEANKCAGRRFQVPNFSVNKMQCLLVNPETQDVRLGRGAVVLSAGTLPRITGIRNSLIIVDGDFMGATAIHNSLLIVRGNIGRVTGVDHSIVLATGNWVGTTGCDDSFVQVNNHQIRFTGARDSVLLNTMIRATVSTSRVLKTDKGPLQRLKFSPRPTDAQLVWSEPVADLAIALAPIDENGRVLIRWKNVGKEPLQFPLVRLDSHAIDSNQDDLLGRVFVKGSDGKLVPARHHRLPRLVTSVRRDECVILEPGRTFEEMIDLWSYVEKPAAGGKYQLSIELDVPVRRRVMDRTVKAWSGEIQSKTLDVVVSK